MRVRSEGPFVAGLLLALMVLPAAAAYTPGSGLIGSPHDFAEGAADAAPGGGQASACAVCHLSEPTQPASGPGPTWNPSLLGASFPWAGAAQTQGGTRLPLDLGRSAGSSKVCLACHSGDHAAPGTVRSLDDQRREPRPPPGKRTGASGPSMLRDTHPVGIPYPFQGAAGTYNGITTGAHVAVEEYAKDPKGVQLFTEAGGRSVRGARTGAAGIECASCHDVHNEQVRDRWLLRDAKQRLCQHCHKY